MNWAEMPTNADLGSVKTFLNLPVFSSRATPNITKASVKFKTDKPS